jgi:hypothetical protein
MNSRTRGRRPLPELARWLSEREPLTGTMFDLRSLRPYPVPYYEKYVHKNVAESIVWNDDVAWASVRRTATALTCRKRTTNGRVGTLRGSYQRPCGDKTCRACATQSMVLHLGHLHRLMSSQSTMWVGALPLDDRGLRTINKSFERGLDIDGVFASLLSGTPPTARPWYSVVRRPHDDRRAYIYASGAPVGRLKSKGDFMDSVEAFEHVRGSMRLPGIVRVPSYSSGAQPPVRVSSPSAMVVTAPDLTAAQQRVYEDRIEVLADDVFGLTADAVAAERPLEYDRLSRTAYAAARRVV